MRHFVARGERMPHVTATIVCRHRRWLKYYLAGVLLMSHVTGRDPHLGRVMRWIERGTVIEVR
ncbi:hypothetical protein CXQ80_13325 [Pseudomonas sp. 02C 26]|uniref:hypothetical protein n=2 Tax=unclassified Pseudomonas TaxID=196821 RepID=UPI000C6E94F1|nr:hypothetical protein [Pseudomonas sp. 02C 26]AUF96745.1 hypothetical protein CXQ80_13325 [Pseudomonas sp. 02C 26]